MAVCQNFAGKVDQCIYLQALNGVCRLQCSRLVFKGSHAAATDVEQALDRSEGLGVPVLGGQPAIDHCITEVVR